MQTEKICPICKQQLILIEDSSATIDNFFYYTYSCNKDHYFITYEKNLKTKEVLLFKENAYLLNDDYEIILIKEYLTENYYIEYRKAFSDKEYIQIHLPDFEIKNLTIDKILKYLPLS